jgi:hypothetical protein
LKENRFEHPIEKVRQLNNDSVIGDDTMIELAVMRDRTFLNRKNIESRVLSPLESASKPDAPGNLAVKYSAIPDQSLSKKASSKVLNPN